MVQPVVTDSLSWRAKQRPAPQMLATALYENTTMQREWHFLLAWCSEVFNALPHTAWQWPILQMRKLSLRCLNKVVRLCSPDLKDHTSKLGREGIKNCPQGPGFSLNWSKHWRNQAKGQKMLMKAYPAGSLHCKKCSRPLKISLVIKSALTYWKDRKTWIP